MLNVIQSVPDANMSLDFGPKIEQIVRPPVCRIAAAQAGLVLRECRYVHQTRDLALGGDQHIAVLADIMRRGQWRPGDKLDFARLGGKLILVNGHHRLAAQVASGQPIEWTVSVHECQSDEEVSALYFTFDTNVRKRSNFTILAATDIGELIGISKMTANALFQAVPLLAADFDFMRQANDPVMNRVVDRRLQMMKAYQGEVLLWESAIKSAPPKLKRSLSTQGAMAVALTTFRHQAKVATEFWAGTAQNDGLKKGDPRHTYLTALNERRTAARSGTAQTTARIAAVAWNAFYAGRSLSFIRSVEAGAFRIAGTPVGR